MNLWVFITFCTLFLAYCCLSGRRQRFAIETDTQLPEIHIPPSLDRRP